MLKLLAAPVNLCSASTVVFCLRVVVLPSQRAVLIETMSESYNPLKSWDCLMRLYTVPSI